MIKHLVGGLIFLLIAFFTPWWVTLPLAFGYACFGFALELVVAAIIIDAYFVSVIHWPYYTLGAILLVFTLEIAKPHLSFFK